MPGVLLKYAYKVVSPVVESVEYWFLLGVRLVGAAVLLAIVVVLEVVSLFDFFGQFIVVKSPFRFCCSS